MSKKFITINGLKLSSESIERLKYIREDAEGFHKGLVQLSDSLIATALEEPEDCIKQIEFLALVSDLRVFVDTFMEEELAR